MFGVSELSNVDLNLAGSSENLDFEDRKKYYPRFTSMFSGFGSTKNLCFDRKSIQVTLCIIFVVDSINNAYICFFEQR